MCLEPGLFNVDHHNTLIHRQLFIYKHQTDMYVIASTITRSVR